MRINFTSKKKKKKLDFRICTKFNETIPASEATNSGDIAMAQRYNAKIKSIQNNKIKK